MQIRLNALRRDHPADGAATTANHKVLIIMEILNYCDDIEKLTPMLHDIGLRVPHVAVVLAADAGTRQLIVGGGIADSVGLPPHDPALVDVRLQVQHGEIA